MENKLLELVTRLSQIAPEVWRIALQQAIVEARVTLLWGLIMLLITGAFGVSAYKLAHYANSAAIPEDDQGWVSGVAIMLGLVAIIALVFGISDILMAYSYFANPEWQAIQLLLAQLK